MAAAPARLLPRHLALRTKYHTIPSRSRSLPSSVYTSPHSYSQHRYASTSQTVLASKIPSPTAFCPDVETFLKLIGRSSSQFASKLTSWETLFGSTSEQLRFLGVEPPRARRYLLRWRERFRKGDFGPCGDLKYISPEGLAELKATTRNGKKVVVNVPVSKTPEGERAENASGESSAKAASSGTSQLKAGARPSAEPPEVPWARVVYPGVVSARFAVPVKGTEGKVARIQIHEGMWEDKRGHKVGKGERFMVRQKTLVERRKRGLIA